MRARGYILFRNENPAESGSEWNQKVYLYGEFYPKPLRRICTREGWKVLTL